MREWLSISRSFRPPCRLAAWCTPPRLASCCRRRRPPRRRRAAGPEGEGQGQRQRRRQRRRQKEVAVNARCCVQEQLRGLRGRRVCACSLGCSHATRMPKKGQGRATTRHIFALRRRARAPEPWRATTRLLLRRRWRRAHPATRRRAQRCVGSADAPRTASHRTVKTACAACAASGQPLTAGRIERGAAWRARAGGRAARAAGPCAQEEPRRRCICGRCSSSCARGPRCAAGHRRRAYRCYCCCRRTRGGRGRFRRGR